MEEKKMLRSLAVILVLTLCACAMPLKDTRLPYERGAYQLLFNKSATEQCVAAFEKENVLYIVSGWSGGRGVGGSYKVTIYNPASTLFITLHILPPRHGTSQSCTAIDFERDVLPTQYRTSISPFFVGSADVRRLFDRYREDPSVLQEAVNAGLPYFTFNRCKQDDCAVNFRRDIRASNLREAAERLRAIDPTEARRTINVNIGLQEDTEAQARQKAEEINRQLRLQDQLRRKAWDERLQQTVSAGDAVCTYDTNIFGNIEAVEGQRVKLYVIGKAQTPAGFFFSGGDRKFSYEKIEGYRWFDRAEIGHCGFKDQLSQ
jgi:hypothetical protein